MVLLIHFAACSYMTGVIWFVQLVHYPLFSGVGADRFVAYEQSHTRLTTVVVAPGMLIEAATGAWLVFSLPTQLGLALLNLLGILAIWAITAFVSVPCHERLGKRFDSSTHRRLVVTNWGRTLIWTGRLGLIGWLLVSSR